MDTRDAFVLDGSVALVWGFEDEKYEYAAAILGRIPELLAHVPSLWSLVVANSLLVGERRRRITPAETTRFLAILRTFPVVVDQETVSHAWAETSNLSRAHHLSAYDAAYLELAVRRCLPLATLDSKLKAAAVDAGVPLYAVG